MMRQCAAALSTVLIFMISLPGFLRAQGPHSLAVDFNYYYYDYVEDVPSPLRSTERGWVPGLHIAYAYRGISNPLYLHLLFEYSEGETDFEGTTQAGTPLSTVTENTFLRYEGNVGYTVTPGRDQHKIDMTIYSGLGYFYWDRGLGGLVPFSEEYSWKYIPVGIRCDYRIGKRWTGAVDASIRFTFSGRININIFNSNNPRADLGNRPGWKIIVPFRYQVYPRLFFVFTPWYEHSEIGMSNTVPLFIGGPPPLFATEPASKTDQIGFRAGVTLLF